ncbi:hypothetical protein HUA74_18420 [Myxococcus sp. CA051A]|uniref:Uncharacterized protein n=1 Tax=Myxococcus llanfairpwllgwyngyllgogerychwyrndrobwllllantysiliogogogochensis TaxID=2590453 RepID=A0A540X7H6_9BACT|nr:MULTISPECIES: hypothetical protein [Myxococcus]NTX62630.1 hypothetical protein [Myxococcus sp. CA051A]TQF17235.1 hypothetical protein FJV41_04115 [Myxococcus llanfairpwllgwyngyllgogerychwyrndrobwllllantysiliogogogochensis]
MSAESRAEARALLVMAATRYERALDELRAAGLELRRCTDGGVDLDVIRRANYALRAQVDDTVALLRSRPVIESVDLDAEVRNG